MGFFKKVTNSVKNVTKAAVTGNVKGVLKESVNAVKDGTKATAKFGKNLTMASVNAAINPGSASLKGLGRASFGLSKAGQAAQQVADQGQAPVVAPQQVAPLTGIARRRARQAARQQAPQQAARQQAPQQAARQQAPQQAQPVAQPQPQRQAKPMGSIKQLYGGGLMPQDPRQTKQPLVY